MDLLEDYDRLKRMRFVAEGPFQLKKINLWDNAVVLQLFREKLVDAFVSAVVSNSALAEWTSTPFVSWGCEIFNNMLELLQTETDMKTFLVVTLFEAHFVPCLVLELTFATRVICSKPVTHPMHFPQDLRGNFFV